MNETETIIEAKENRALATIETIKWLKPIDGADLIELAGVRGWQCVVKKGEFAVGAPCVFFEIDSFVPASNPVFGFLEPKFIEYTGVMGARIRHRRMLKQLSQGLALPLNMFPTLSNKEFGDNVTHDIGVMKWEPPIPSQIAGEAVGVFPTYLCPKTEEERIQNITDMSQVIGHTFEVSIKLDGTSTTVIHHNGERMVCGRNYNLRNTGGNSLWNTAIQYGIHDGLEKIGLNAAIQGELIGEKICTNIEKIRGCDFYVFRIYLIDERRFATPAERMQILKNLVDVGCILKHVPILEQITFDEHTTVDSILAMADGPSLFAKFREGLVFKRTDGQFSFKAISNWWLDRYSN